MKTTKSFLVSMFIILVSMFAFSSVSFAQTSNSGNVEFDTYISSWISETVVEKNITFNRLINAVDEFVKINKNVSITIDYTSLKSAINLIQDFRDTFIKGNVETLTEKQKENVIKKFSSLEESVALNFCISNILNCFQIKIETE